MSRYQDIIKFRKSFDLVTNWVHYPIAGFLCTLLSYTAITPNQITFLAIFSELSAVYFILTGFESNLILIVVLLQLGWIFDLMDGMMARYKKMGFYQPEKPSVKGYYLDAVSDHVLKYIIIGSLSYYLAGQLEYGWLFGLVSLVIHAITQTEHTMRHYILKNMDNEPKSNLESSLILQHVALIMNNIYLYYLIFIPLNRVDLFFIIFASGEIILFLKRVIQFWTADH